MKQILILAAITIGFQAFSQELPRKSAKAEIEQVVGLNSIEIAYSRPSVNDRIIFGELVPYGEVWRLGANQSTKIEIEYPIFINGQKLDTGTYAIYAIPTKNQWNVVFNTDHKQWGSNDYDPKKNVLEYTAAVSANQHTESFTISFESVNETSAILSFAWAQVKVSIPFTTETLKAVEEGIEAAIAEGEDLARVYSRAADYFNDEGDVTKAEMYLDKSLQIEKSYYNVFLQAQMMKDKDLKGAIKLAEEAAALAEKAEKENWARYIKKNIEEWK